MPATSLGAREKQWSSLAANALYDKSFNKCSSSCENLDIGKTQSCEHFAPHPKLCKASSDNPVYGAAAPPIPPRDYTPLLIDRPSLRPRAEIHPILQDGEQRSSTHYWLLPDKQRISVSSQANKIPELYMNVPHPISPPGATAVSRTPDTGTTGRGGRSGPAEIRSEPSRTGSKKGMHDWSNSTVPLLADEADMDTASVDLPYGESLICKSIETSEHDAHKSAKSPIGHHSDYELEQPTGAGSTSMIEAQEMIEQVRGGVSDVSEDEACTALSTHRWNVGEAVKYIKVEHLFRLALASRQTCQSLLEKYGWNLEMAASALVDLPCSKSSSFGGGHASAKTTSHNREQSPKLQSVVIPRESKPSAVVSTSKDLSTKQPSGSTLKDSSGTTVRHLAGTAVKDSSGMTVKDQQLHQSRENNPPREDQPLSKRPNVVKQKTSTVASASREHYPATQRDQPTKQ